VHDNPGNASRCIASATLAERRRLRQPRRVAAHGSIELTWPGKDLGDLSPTAFRELELIERVGASTPDNLLIHGDNLAAMRALLERYEGGIDLIYIDPPFATGLSYYSQTTVGDDEVERRAYRDRAGGMVEYLAAMQPRIALMHRLLSPEGKLFLHCDWRANSMLRLILDEIFGPECFRNEIVWRRAPNLGRQAASRQLGRVIDTIYVYSKSRAAPFRGTPPKRATRVELDGHGKPKGARWDEQEEAYFTTAPRGDYTDKSIAQLREKNRVYQTATGTIYIKYFLRQDDDGHWVKDQPIDALWDDYEVRPLRHRPKGEEMGYDTQKPEGLLERVIGWATVAGDRVADFYCGSGTTLAVAEAMGRKWIGCDVGRPAIDIVRRRLLDRSDAASFDLVTTHEFERRAWCRANGPANVIAAYGGTPGSGASGEREGALVRVLEHGSATEIYDACDEARARGAKRVTLLAWHWASDARAASAIVNTTELCLEQRTIPIEIARGARASDLAFLRPPMVDLVLKDGGQELSVALTGLCCPDRSVQRGAIGEIHWSDLVSGWMIDWRFEGRFQPDWRSYRRRGERALALESPGTPRASCGDCVHVAVLTVFGDTILQILPIAKEAR
jgi:DNA modification methylase